MNKNLLSNILITIATLLGLGGIAQNGLELRQLRQMRTERAVVAPQPAATLALALALAAAAAAPVAPAEAPAGQTATGVQW